MTGLLAKAIRWGLALTLDSLALGCSAGQSSAPRVPPEVMQGGWPLATADYSNTRATTAATVDSHNVQALGVAWALPVVGAKGNPGTHAVSANTTFTWRRLPMISEGGYGFWIQPANNDNTPLIPPALADVGLNMIGFHPD